MIEFTKSWNSTCNIVKAIVYINYHDMFTIMITQTWHNMSCFCLAVHCHSRIITTNQTLKINKNWIWKIMKKNLKIISLNHFSKYVKYKQNYFTCLHKNEITRFLQSSWKTLRKLLNQNHMLIHNQLYLKNIITWLMFLKDKMLTSCFHIKKNMIFKLI